MGNGPKDTADKNYLHKNENFKIGSTKLLGY